MKQIIAFLQALDANNNREWFMAHKAEYELCKARFETLVQEVIGRIGEYDETVRGLQAKDCVYRIYRDTRFSSDKTPYKMHMGAYIVRGGKKSGYSGYYFQVGARDGGFPGGSVLATGDYCCEKEVLQIVREDIMNDPDEFEQTLQEAAGWTVDYDGALKKAPKGFPADQPYSQYLRLKAYCVLKTVDSTYMSDAHLAERLAADFRQTMPFLHFINRAIEYVKEEK